MQRSGFQAGVLVALAAIATGGLSVIPERILFAQRFQFSLLELEAERPIRPFEHVTHDRLTIRSWMRPAEPGKPVIVYFPGRDGNILFKPWHLYELAEQGYGLLLVGYRGYGGNPGRPREFAMQLDAVSLVRQAHDAGLMPDGYVLYGYSMGSGFAAGAAVALEPRGVILEAPISRFLDAVRQQARFVPGFLVRTRFDNVARLAQLQVPILLLAGGQDAITPPWFAAALAEASKPNSTLHVVDEANHFTIIRRGGNAIVNRFLEELEPGETEPAPLETGLLPGRLSWQG